MSKQEAPSDERHTTAIDWSEVHRRLRDMAKIIRKVLDDN